MPSISRLHFRAAVVFLVVAVLAGLQMSISGDHASASAHAHAALLGWVSLALFGTYFAFEPGWASSGLARVQFWLTVISVAITSFGLYLLLQGNQSMEPVVAIGSLGFALAVLIFAWMVFVPPAHAVKRQGGAVAH